MLRGLAHPAIFAMGGRAPTDQQQGPGSPSGPFRLFSPAQRRRTGGNVGYTRTLETFGAVPLSGRNMHALLKAGEAVLLYPGGAREAFKHRGEEYQLIWPEKSEFVRMAARFGATIVPFACVGADESVTQLLDAKDIAGLPFVGNWIKESQRSLPAARRGVNATVEDVGAFVPPLVAPAVPQRFYFIFRKPILTDAALAEDREACQRVYDQTRSEVEDGFGYLLRKRMQDPYRELLPRLVYEASWGGKQQAPTFKP